MCFINRRYSRQFPSATIPQPHTAASPLTSADTPSRKSRHLTTQTDCSLKGLQNNYQHIFIYTLFKTYFHMLKKASTVCLPLY